MQINRSSIRTIKGGAKTMDKKPKLGSDPLEWIRDTWKDMEGIEEGKQGALF